jgi:hypothetical protein
MSTNSLVNVDDVQVEEVLDDVLENIETVEEKVEVKVEKKAKVAKAAKEEKKVEKVAKIKFDAKSLVMPKGSEMKVMKSCVKFTNGTKWGYLKGWTLEVTNPTKDLAKDIHHVTEAEAEKYHLGKTKGIIRNLDQASLQTIINKYFKA